MLDLIWLIQVVLRPKNGHFAYFNKSELLLSDVINGSLELPNDRMLFKCFELKV